MNKILTLKDSINLGKGKKIPVSEIVNKKGEIFNYIKNGYQFDDEVLEKAHIVKKISNERIISDCVEYKKVDKKALPKETESVKNILKSINTIDSQNIDENSFFTNDDTVLSDE